ncbi:MAG: O-antigen ligase family protein [Candidatus Omnitrophica bacterium]|nr:O-antigen ligase family protein [Candidatus Omnitrophota bacterium]MCF7877667.1 O-antigen ligase family protein [Candidatus Omnitrophota bacterium]MCF7892307.1 O-antigen ligase family protein [Candidatus Omnitrophota bacterium]MCF7895818.1 O-antigen ligase family protein [Candidatus Omnitrophota bacterium]MCF7897638.1 O-antigen ligase family protein [Candidatus Omnitrophota bacterium]
MIVAKYLDWILLSSCAVFLAGGIYSTKIAKVCALIAIGAFVLLRAYDRSKPFLKNFFEFTPLNKAIYCFLAVAGLTTIFGLLPYESQKVFFNRYIIYFFIFFVGAFIGKRKFAVKMIILSLSIGAVLVSVGGLIDLFSGGSLRRLLTSFGVPIYGTYFLYTLPFLIGFMIFHPSLKLKLISFVAAVPVFTAFIFHGSRGVWLGLIIGFIITIILCSKKRGYLFGLSLLVVVLIGSVNFARERVMRSENYSSVEVRFETAASAINIFKEYPIFGVGPGNYGGLMQNYYPDEAEGARKHLHAHNTYLEVLAEMGILGLLSLLWILALFFRRGYRAIKKEPNAYNVSFMIMFLAVLVSEFFMSVILVGIAAPVIFWLLLGAGTQVFKAKKIDKVENAI